MLNVGRRSLRGIYHERLTKEMKASRPKMLYVVSYDLEGSTPAMRMKLSRHVQALMEVSHELGLVFERRSWSCFLCDERTMPIFVETLKSLGCKPDVFPIALNLTVVERHLMEALRSIRSGELGRAERHIEAALRELRGEPCIIEK